MRLLYYNLYVCKNGVKTDYPLEKVIDTIYIKKPADRLCNLRLGDYSLTKMREPDQERETRNRSFWISKYRDRKPLTGTKGTDEAEPISKDVMETANCLLIPAKNFLAMEYSHLGCRINGLVEYLNQFLFNDVDSETSDRWHIEYIKITEKSSFNIIASSANIKRIDVEFNSKGQVKDLLNEGSSDAKTVLEKLLRSSMEAANYINANIATFVVKKGRQSNTMTSTDVVKLLKVIHMDNDNIISVKVIFDNPITGKKNDTVDLKHDGQMQDEVPVDNDLTAFEILAQKINEYYYGDGGRKGLSFSNKYVTTAIDPKTIIYRMS